MIGKALILSLGRQQTNLPVLLLKAGMISVKKLVQRLFYLLRLAVQLPIS